ncbi:MAG: P-loop NTPase, partial [Terriglobia bacterium]
MADRISLQEVLRALAGVAAPGGGNIVSREFVKDLEVGDQSVSFTLQMPGPPQEHIAEQARRAVAALGIPNVRVQLAAGATPAASPHAKLIPGVASTIAVASGKGGVGKSTVAVNLAVALNREGARVGLMDTDVYGPSVPHLMGSRTAPEVIEGKIAPPVEHGIRIMSMAYFLPADEAVIWR